LGVRQVHAVAHQAHKALVQNFFVVHQTQAARRPPPLGVGRSAASLLP
jgi:hypothetical protein